MNKNQTPNINKECGPWPSTTRRGGQARPWGLLQSTAPIRPSHHQPSTWLLRREGVTSTHLAWRGAPDAAAGNGQVCGPPDGCKEDVHKGVFRELMGAGCRWGGHGNCVRALTHLGVLQPPRHIPSRSMGLTPRTHPPNALMSHGGLPATHLRLSGDPCLLCFLWMQCVSPRWLTSTNPWCYSRSCHCSGICRKNAHCRSILDC